MTTTKTIFTLSSLAFLAMFGGGLYLFANVDGFAKAYIEKTASAALGVPVEIGALDIALQDKKAVVSNLSIANPEGFSTKPAVTISTISVQLGKLSEQLITFQDISVTNTLVNIEVNENATNLMAIKNGMKQAPPKSDNQAKPLKVIVDHFALNKAQVKPSITLIKADLEPVIVPDIKLTGIGQKENGILAREAIAQIWNHISSQFSSAAGGAGFYQGMSSDALQQLGVSSLDQIKQDIKGIGSDLKKSLFGE